LFLPGFSIIYGLQSAERRRFCFYFVLLGFLTMFSAIAVMLPFLDGINDNDHDLYGIFATLFMIGGLGLYIHTHEQPKTKRNAF